jgi:hypothetical protein
VRAARHGGVERKLDGVFGQGLGEEVGEGLGVGASVAAAYDSGGVGGAQLDGEDAIGDHRVRRDHSDGPNCFGGCSLWMGACPGCGQRARSPSDLAGDRRSAARTSTSRTRAPRRGPGGVADPARGAGEPRPQVQPGSRLLKGLQAGANPWHTSVAAVEPAELSSSRQRASDLPQIVGPLYVDAGGNQVGERPFLVEPGRGGLAVARILGVVGGKRLA